MALREMYSGPCGMLVHVHAMRDGGTMLLKRVLLSKHLKQRHGDSVPSCCTHDPLQSSHIPTFACSSHRIHSLQSWETVATQKRVVTRTTLVPTVRGPSARPVASWWRTSLQSAPRDPDAAIAKWPCRASST